MTIKDTNLQFKNTPGKRYNTKRIVLHHADASVCDAITIHRWHQSNGWSGIGYHFLVRKNGTIERGRPEDTIGAHCLNNNSDSIGICFEGNFDKEIMSETQLKTGQELLSYLYKKYNLTKSNVYRHRDLMATDCPGKNFPFDKVIAGVTTTNNITKDKKTKYTQKMFIKDVCSILGASTGKKAFSKTITISKSKNVNHHLVTPLERYMKSLGYYTGAIEADSGSKPYFGGGMESAIKKYQKEVIKANPKFQDGIITAGGATWKRLLGIK